jgi:hypothetical protein
VDFEQCRDGGELEEDARLNQVSEGLMVGQTWSAYFRRGTLSGGRGYKMNLEEQGY